eukprot:scaffold45596_cov72-Phaeocystis_antarctica.AAC.2
MSLEVAMVSVPLTKTPPPCQKVQRVSIRKAQKASTPAAQPDYRTRWCWSALPCPRCRVPRHPANHEHTRNVPAGHWMKVQGYFKWRAQRTSTPTCTVKPDWRTRWCWSTLPCPRCRVPRQSANHEHA